MKYKLYRAEYPQGSGKVRPGGYDEVAVSEEAMDEPEDFFLSGHSGVTLFGEIEVEGDTHLLPDHFSLTTA